MEKKIIKIKDKVDADIESWTPPEVFGRQEHFMITISFVVRLSLSLLLFTLLSFSPLTLFLPLSLSVCFLVSLYLGLYPSAYQGSSGIMESRWLHALSRVILCTLPANIRFIRLYIRWRDFSSSYHLIRRIRRLRRDIVNSTFHFSYLRQGNCWAGSSSYSLLIFFNLLFLVCSNKSWV